ncbi:hypothetical protein M1N18_00315 [Dehalococcoidales bacterium]|nr:hypothetical protein [Dehalococcoidales bacterium]MCL0052911.1 hypothetical protein [Dehalococcoidales bacterium]
MIDEKYLAEARSLYQKAIEEFGRARERNDPTLLRDACAKGWLAAVEAAYALILKKGVKEEELPKADRGRGYMLSKYAPREIRLYYFALRDRLHIEGYYDGSLSFEEVGSYLEDLNLFIQKVEEAKI